MESLHSRLHSRLRWLQGILGFEEFPLDSQFCSERVRTNLHRHLPDYCLFMLIIVFFCAPTKGLGRVATLSVILGALWGLHLSTGVLLLLHNHFLLVPWLNETLGDARVHLLCQWCGYVVVLTTFHLLEFFTTAIYNPTVTTADSFLVNHSTGYTAAFLTSATEFWIGFLIWPTLRNSYVSFFGLVLVLLAQFLRSLAMATCGESFNHRIQTSKKDNHVLIAHGM